MGQVIIEIPQNVNRSYQVKDKEFGERLLQNLEEFEKKTKSDSHGLLFADALIAATALENDLTIVTYKVDDLSLFRT